MLACSAATREADTKGVVGVSLGGAPASLAREARVCQSIANVRFVSGRRTEDLMKKSKVTTITHYKSIKYTRHVV